VATIDRHGPKRGGVLCPFRGALGTRLIQYGMRGGLLPYQVASSSKLRLSSSLIGGEMSCRRDVHVIGEVSSRQNVS